MSGLMIDDVLAITKSVFQKHRRNSDSSKRRESNIFWIAGLKRDELGLKFRQKERQILIHRTSDNEELYIQYPGKESADKTERGRPRKAVRPWDFRPKVVLGKDGTYEKDLSFTDIWATLIEQLSKKQNSHLIPIMTTAFYRMAYMLDHESRSKAFLVRTGHVANDRFVVETSEEQIHTVYLYTPMREVIDFLSNALPTIGRLSLEAFLFYNDLLAFNEDCKYYFSKVIVGNKKWINATGRVNNLLTHISVLGYVGAKISLASLLGRLVQNQGVAPATEAEIVELSEGIIGYDGNASQTKKIQPSLF